MKNNKKGFTLIELLAVIAILAILVVLAVPAILNLFNDSRRNAFVTQAQTVYKAAEEEYLTKQITPGEAITAFCNVSGSSEATLTLEGTNDLTYSIIFDTTTGKISKFKISNANFSITKNTISSISDITAVDDSRTAVSACSFD